MTSRRRLSHLFGDSTPGVMTQFIASMLWSASMHIPQPEFHRHEMARRDLLRAMRKNEERSW